MMHEIGPVESDVAEKLKKIYNHDIRSSFIKVAGTIIPDCYKPFADAIENFEVRDDDIWVCSFPKTGTTWTQEMVWSIAKDSEFSKVPLTQRFPYFELCTIADFAQHLQRHPEINLPELVINSVGAIDKLPGPRFIKTHLPFHLLPRQLRTGEKQCKIVYVVRNAKDTCISYYHHTKHLDGIDIDFNEFCNSFIADSVLYAPFWEHVLGYWKRRIDENLLFLKFEDMKKDLPWVIKKTAIFLGKNLTTDQLSILSDHLSFATMKNNPAANNDDLFSSAIHKSEKEAKFMRSGQVEQWKADMSTEQIEQFDNWTRENLKRTRLYF